MLSQRTTSITEARQNLAALLDSLETNGAVLIVRHSRPAAYLVAADMFDAILERLEDLEDVVDMRSVISDYHAGEGIPLEEALQDLGL